MGGIHTASTAFRGDERATGFQTSRGKLRSGGMGHSTGAGGNNFFNSQFTTMNNINVNLNF